MRYRSLLAHVSPAPESPARYRLAAAIALAEGARVVGAATTGINEFIYRYAAAAAMAPLAQQELDFFTASAKADLLVFQETLRQAGASRLETQLSDDEPVAALPLLARYSDLLLIGQRHAADALLADSHALARNIAVHAPCPVLMVPPPAPSATAATTLPSRILLAWDGSMEASRAVRAALPLLHHAQSVAAVTYLPAQHLPDQEHAGAALADYLACHGITVELLQPPHAGDTGQALLALAAARGTELIVMGCFGHSRLREVVLGGVSRTVLAQAQVPVLLCH